MRHTLIAALLLAGAAAPAVGQSIDRRVDRLEQEMRAVQRKVFPQGPELQPEIGPQTTPVVPGGVPADSALSDLTARVDALESSLARLTGQTEENAFRIRQLETALEQLKAAAAAPPPVLTPPSPVEVDTAEPDAPAPDAAPSDATPPAADAPATGDPAEDAYLTGFRQWEAGQFADAQVTLDAMAKRWPKHRRASWARNLAGRALLDAGKPAAAAKALLANYQADAKGERAADSLFFLGQALVALKKPTEACEVYAELDSVYGAGMRDFLRTRLPGARDEAGCT